MRRYFVEECTRLPITAAAADLMHGPEAVSNVQVTLSAGETVLTFDVRVTRQPAGVVGFVNFWVCPICQKRVRDLYLPPDESDFRCRVCWKLSYRTQGYSPSESRRSREERLFATVTNARLSWKTWFRAYRVLMELQAHRELCAEACRDAIKARHASKPVRPYIARGRGRPSKRWHQENANARCYLELLECDPEDDERRDPGSRPRELGPERLAWPAHVLADPAGNDSTTPLSRDRGHGSGATLIDFLRPSIGQEPRTVHEPMSGVTASSARDPPPLPLR